MCYSCLYGVNNHVGKLLETLLAYSGILGYQGTFDIDIISQNDNTMDLGEKSRVNYIYLLVQKCEGESCEKVNKSIDIFT